MDKRKKGESEKKNRVVILTLIASYSLPSFLLTIWRNWPIIFVSRFRLSSRLNMAKARLQSKSGFPFANGQLPCDDVYTKSMITFEFSLKFNASKRNDNTCYRSWRNRRLHTTKFLHMSNQFHLAEGFVCLRQRRQPLQHLHRAAGLFPFHDVSTGFGLWVLGRRQRRHLLRHCFLVLSRSSTIEFWAKLS